MQKDRALTEEMEYLGLDPQDSKARKIVQRYRNAEQGSSLDKFADAQQAMDGLFSEHAADADPRKLNMARLTASTRPVDFGEGDSFRYLGMTMIDGGMGERYAATGRSNPENENYVIDWAARQSARAVADNVAAQARSGQEMSGAAMETAKPMTAQELKRAQYLNRVTSYKDPNKQNALELQQLYGFKGKAADGDFGPTIMDGKRDI